MAEVHPKELHISLQIPQISHFLIIKLKERDTCRYEIFRIIMINNFLQASEGFQYNV